MNTMEHFLELRLRFREVETHRSFEVSLEELSEVLVCSTRNVKRLLKNMEKEGLIYWKPGGGRGKRSKLYFRCSLKKALLSHIQDLLKREKHSEAMDWIKREGLPAEVRDACFRILLKEFSFPRIAWTDYIRMKEQASGRFQPVLISSASGKWMLVEGGRSQTAVSYRTGLSRTVERRSERE
jgi:DNA-binding MarR family transcriptional regulator